MLLVLDSNEYIFAFGLFKKPSCGVLVEKIIRSSPAHNIRIPRLIVEEVKRNLTPEEFKEFIEFAAAITSIDEDFFVPFEIGIKYEAVFKPQDAFIAAYVEWTGADILVSENRHFLSRHDKLPFRVINAEQCLKVLTK